MDNQSKSSLLNKLTQAATAAGEVRKGAALEEAAKAAAQGAGNAPSPAPAPNLQPRPR